LPAKLAKYLSPQVYASIFAGRQEVKLASQRKKLTVFFSDLAGFTELTDQMESEDLTELLNHYLTEMSRIALAHGGTVDKYVGDALMVFFGDPETRGVKEDALACVRMGIAMQARMRELAAAWRNAGIERPLACRIGIHTGYCTVGNFGSEDRMDYTIIGGAVNLASRLEHEAPPGGILLSFDTVAHVKDEIRCEEMGRITVRGLAHPVATYRVVDVHAAGQTGRIRSELPHLRLEAEPELMSADEREQAAGQRAPTLHRSRTNSSTQGIFKSQETRSQSRRAPPPPRPPGSRRCPR
jgi:adenylate cyclase